MLSGIKFVPRDQALSSKKGAGGGESDSDAPDRKRRDKKGRDKEEEKRRRGRRRRSRYNSGSEEGSDTDDSIGEEEDFSRGKHRRRRCGDFSDEESESSSESEKGRSRGKGKGKQRGDDEDEIGDEGGYPEESTPSTAGSQLLASSVVGDGGASWRLKALKRAKEQSAREGRQLDEVIEERWGSLGHLAASVSTSRAAHSHAHLHAIRGRKSGKMVIQKNMLKELQKVGNLESKTADVSTLTTDVKRDNDQKLLKESSAKVPVLSTQKLNANQLAAKILQLRMKGKLEEAEQHSMTELLSVLCQREMEALLESQDTAVEEPRHERERSSIRNTIKPSAADRRKREEDADLHLANKIMHNKQYNMSKSIEDEYDFGDAPSKKDKRKNKEGHQDKRGTNRPMLTQKERCLYCFENPSRPKHLVVAIGNFTYLMLPQFEPVVPGHHESGMRTVDQNVWVEIRNFKKCLLQMFGQQDKDVVFMETVVSLARQRRHCMIECIPVPCEVSNNAPMYLKKAIDEAEEEWSQHEMKKIITTNASRNLRQVIPENFAYFHVEFGLDRGFVHVIGDENKFNAGFGLNVIRGMLRLPEEDMHRRRRHESMDKQKQAVASFMKDWEPFDWTKQLD
ncbi:hypothetical protein PR202_ga10039 [Eleusine coracana subsp. coracana]|uniref:CWF19-like protein 2 n=1 Tax=Eleusine coracana subsp. coracana TaxID=191504 RepID=A0AAV5C5P1_ELECO|nr:hypothetical protein PR202_ga10039 [Eleusine coracana subsp. coracana]